MISSRAIESLEDSPPRDRRADHQAEVAHFLAGLLTDPHNSVTFVERARSSPASPETDSYANPLTIDNYRAVYKGRPYLGHAAPVA
jgi:hypothetical protein